ncbi:TonB-dependent receptor [Thauera sinica]|nr:TonB-dependent receptor [Thauera sp. K11]
MQDEDPFLEPLPVVLSVSRLPQPVQDAPGAITVIDADLIAATGYRDLGRLLRLAPGMQVGQERSNTQWLTYHGLGFEVPAQLQVLVDGRSLNPRSLGVGANFGSLRNIERIEVVRGSNSAAYGSNAFLGVVNIISRHTGADEGSTVALNMGDHGIADLDARFVSRQGPLGLRLTARHFGDDGFAGLHDGRQANVLNLRGDLRVSETDEIDFTAGIGEERGKQGYPGMLFETDRERSSRHTDTALHLRWRHAPSADEEWSLSWYHTRNSFRDEWFVESRANLPPALAAYAAALPAMRIAVGDSIETARNNVELQHRFLAAPDLRLLWGAEWRGESTDSRFFFHGAGRRKREEWRVFGNLEWRSAPQWLWNLGALAERIDDGPTRIAPRLFLNWQPSTANTWRIGYSRAWRQPSLLESAVDLRIIDETHGLLQQRFLPNPDLRPPRIDAFELGFVGALPQLGGSLDVRLFHENIRDLIVRRMVDVTLDAGDNTLADPNLVQRLLRATRWQNAADAVRLSGIEYQLRTRPWTGGEFILNHAIVRAAAKDADIERNVAPYSASLTWLQRHGAWRSALTLLRMGPIDAGFGFTPTFRYTVPAYTTLDASVARSFRFDHQPVEIRLTAVNLLGRHQEYANRPLQQSSRFGRDRPANEVGPQVWLSIGTRF